MIWKNVWVNLKSWIHHHQIGFSLHILVRVGLQHYGWGFGVQEEFSDVLNVLDGDVVTPGNLGSDGRRSQQLNSKPEVKRKMLISGEIFQLLRACKGEMLKCRSHVSKTFQSNRTKPPFQIVDTNGPLTSQQLPRVQKNTKSETKWFANCGKSKD